MLQSKMMEVFMLGEITPLEQLELVKHQILITVKIRMIMQSLCQ